MENSIEWLTGQDTISCTLSQKRLINKVRKLAKKYPDMVQIIAENEDGSIFAHLPLKALKLNIITRNLAEDYTADEDEREDEE